jgi:hypothetical protein
MCQQQYQAEVLDQLKMENENEINISSISKSTETICTSSKDQHEPPF